MLNVRIPTRQNRTKIYLQFHNPFTLKLKNSQTHPENYKLSKHGALISAHYTRKNRKPPINLNKFARTGSIVRYAQLSDSENFHALNPHAPTNIFIAELEKQVNKCRGSFRVDKSGFYPPPGDL